MAWSTIENELDTNIYTNAYAVLARLAGPDRHVHRAHINHNNFAVAMKEGVDKWLDSIAYKHKGDPIAWAKVKKINTVEEWKIATTKAFTNLKTSGRVYITSTGQRYKTVGKLARAWFPIYKTVGAGDRTQIVFGTKTQKAPIGIIIKTINFLKDEVFDAWDKQKFASDLDALKSGSNIDWGKGPGSPQTAHRPGSTVGEIGVEDLIKTYILHLQGSNINMDLKPFNMTTVDLIENAMTVVKLYIKTKPKHGSWTISEDREVVVDVADKNPLLSKNDWTSQFKAIIKWAFWVECQKLKFISPAHAADADASQPFNQYVNRYYNAQVRQVAIKAYTGRAKITGNKEVKVPKRKPRTFTYKPPSRPLVKVAAISISSKGTFKAQKVEKGLGKQASTSTARELVRLKRYIQGRLPAEVRRNMGRPALQNRTGRFSNSVELLSLTQAKNTIMARYTYLLSPYSTFENEGLRRWPLAYNPKPLIAKSIRNLAQGRIEQKITVRRV